MQGFFTISEVERDTGIAKETLRVWERRYGFPDPVRDELGERQYSPAQLTRLRLVRRLIDQGERPGKVVPLSLDALSRMMPLGEQGPEGLLSQARLENAAEGAALAAPLSGTNELPWQAVQIALHEQNGPALRRHLQHVLWRDGLAHFVSEFLPALNDYVGNAWAQGKLSIAAEHLYTEQVQTVLRAYLSRSAGEEPLLGVQGPPADGPRVLLTTLPNEAHGLGLLMVEALLTASGAACFSLGPQTPVNEICDAAERYACHVVALSFSAAFPPRKAVQSLQALRTRLTAPTALWAGGRALQRQQRHLSGVTVVDHIRQIPTLIDDWRQRA